MSTSESTSRLIPITNDAPLEAPRPRISYSTSPFVTAAYREYRGVLVGASSSISGGAVKTAGSVSIAGSQSGPTYPILELRESSADAIFGVLFRSDDGGGASEQERRNSANRNERADKSLSATRHFSGLSRTIRIHPPDRRTTTCVVSCPSAANWIHAQLACYRIAKIGGGVITSS